MAVENPKFVPKSFELFKVEAGDFVLSRQLGQSLARRSSITVRDGTFAFSMGYSWVIVLKNGKRRVVVDVIAFKQLEFT